MRFVRIGAAAVVLPLVLVGWAAAPAAAPAIAAPTTDGPLTDVGPVGPIDRGDDPRTTADAITPVPNPQLTGAWSSAAPWPLGALNAILLPDGKVLTYGVTAGRPSYGFDYDVWDPTRGLGADSHTTLPVRTKTNLFCSAQTVLSTGRVLITGGEENGAVGGGFNDAVNDVNLFDPQTNTLTRLADEMAYPRWYPTTTTLPNGEVLVHGGRDDKDASPTLVPEVYSVVNGWRRLPGAASTDVYGGRRWWYPRSWVAPDGNVFVVTKSDRGMWSLDPSGRGTITRLGTYPGPSTDHSTPAAMFDVGRILLTRRDGRASVVDINAATPRVTETGSLRSYRAWSDATVLADGQVLVSGGASRNQQLDHAIRYVEIWNPETGRWRKGAAAAKARLYHSSALLLPDGTVLTAGGGPPGPVTNLNAEIYYPPYLFADDGSGRLATRPRNATVGDLAYDAAMVVRVTGAQRVSKVALVRTGSVTHSVDMDQRFLRLDFDQAGDRLTVRGPANPRVAPPGRYLLFVFDERGVPSVAEILTLVPAARHVSAGVQTGSVTLPQGSTARWIAVTFERAFDRTPVVAAGAASANGGRPVMARVRNVTTTGFDLKLDTWPHLPTRHTFETLSFIAAEPGRHQVGDVTLEAGAFTADAAWRRTRYRTAFDQRPIVVAQLASDFDERAATVRVRRVGNGRFEARLQGDEADERRGRRHGQETVHYLALTPGRGRIDGRPIWVGATSASVTDTWTDIRFGRRLATPRVIAAAQTTRGSDPVVARHDAITPRTARVRMQEERSVDREVRHAAERVGYVAVGSR